MPVDQPVQCIAPEQVLAAGEAGAFPFELYQARCLAQGDSWFSIGALPPPLTSNVLDAMVLSKAVVVVNCARPAKLLQHMADTSRDRRFLRLLSGKLALRWDAILLSGGGNDLIDAAGVGPTAPPALRLLATPAERGPGPLPPSGYVSAAGWATFEHHLAAVFAALVDRRDSGINRQVPLVLHTYAHLMPRPAGAGAGFGPWLQPALDAFAVPPADREAVARELLDRLADLLARLVAQRQAQDPGCALHLVDTRAAGLVPAEATATGASGDWVNEIHPSRAGYRKCAAVWRATLDHLV